MQTSENCDKRGLSDSLRWAALCARISLGAAFLSGIADRDGRLGTDYGFVPGGVTDVHIMRIRHAGDLRDDQSH